MKELLIKVKVVGHCPQCKAPIVLKEYNSGRTSYIHLTCPLIEGK